MVTTSSAHNQLCQLLASELLLQTVDRFSEDISDNGGIHTSCLVSGTRDACFALSELGVLFCDERGYYRPVFPHHELTAWIKERTYARQEQDILLRGVCHLWSWFLSIDFKYNASLETMDIDLLEAFQGVGLIKQVDWEPRWSTNALPWLIEAELADVNEIRAASFKEGALILTSMPEADTQRYANLAKNHARRVLCLICANWDGSIWESRGHNFIQPSSDWRLSQAKSALELLLHDGPLS